MNGMAEINMIKPKRLKYGDTVALISPSSHPDMNRLEMGKQWLIDQGFRVVTSRHVGDQRGYLAGADQARADDLMEMFMRKDVDAVWCAQGGYGSMRILDLLDYDQIRENPKVFIGYSDITGLHSAMHVHSRLIAFHGPLAAHEVGEDFSEYTQQHLLQAVTCSDTPIRIFNPPDAQPVRPITMGKARGKLVGGNLSLIANLMGTPYEMDFNQKILVIEDVSEAPYRIDRMLVQLLLARKLQNVRGIIVGECVDCDPQESNQPSLDLFEVLNELLGGLHIPVMYGLTIGHGHHKATFPLGVEAEMDSESGVLTLLESGVK